MISIILSLLFFPVEPQIEEGQLYFYLCKNFKEINLAAAQKGLELFSEHTAEAKKNPGSHPNIDRLINIVTTNDTLRVETILR